MSRPGRSSTPSPAAVTSSSVTRARIWGSTLVPVAATWTTTRTLAGKSRGSAATMARKGCNPPAEAPITTTSRADGGATGSGRLTAPPTLRARGRRARRPRLAAAPALGPSRRGAVADLRPLHRAGARSGSCVELLEDLAQQPRDVHLREPDALADLALGQVLLHAQPEDLPLAMAERLHERLDGRPVIGAGVAGVLAAHEVAELGRLLAVADGGRERRGGVGDDRLAGLQHLLELETRVIGELLDRGRAAERVRQLRGRALDEQRVLLEGARRADGPAAVTEMPAQLPEHRGQRIAGERRAIVRIEAVDRLEQPEAGDLDKVVEGLATPRVVVGRVAGQRQVAPDELLAHPQVARGRVAAQQAQVGGCVAAGRGCVPWAAGRDDGGRHAWRGRATRAVWKIDGSWLTMKRLLEAESCRSIHEPRRAGMRPAALARLPQICRWWGRAGVLLSQPTARRSLLQRCREVPGTGGGLSSIGPPSGRLAFRPLDSNSAQPWARAAAARTDRRSRSTGPGSGRRSRTTHGRPRAASSTPATSPARSAASVARAASAGGRRSQLVHRSLRAMRRVRPGRPPPVGW